MVRNDGNDRKSKNDSKTGIMEVIQLMGTLRFAHPTLLWPFDVVRSGVISTILFLMGIEFIDVRNVAKGFIPEKGCKAGRP